MAFYSPLQRFLDNSTFAKNNYCPQTYLQQTITVQGRTFSELLLSAHIPLVDYYCLCTYLQLINRYVIGLLLSPPDLM